MRETEKRATETLAELEAEVARKRSEVVRVLEEIRRVEVSVDAETVRSPGRDIRLTPQRDTIVAKYNREMSELV